MIPEAASKLPRNFILAHFFPASLFVFLALILLKGTEGSLTAKLIPLAIELPSTDLVTIAATFFLLSLPVAVVLQILNTTIIKMFEGLVPWPRLVRLASTRARRRYRRRRARIEYLKSTNKNGSNRAEELLDDAFVLEWELLREYPSQEASILPTRLGNIIAAFEHYPFRRYKMDAITLWPRLYLVLDKERSEAIGSAKAMVDCLLNVSFLAGTYAALGLAITEYGVWSRMQVFFGALLVSCLSYRMSFGLAFWWGELVKSAFDVYRLDLLRKIGVVTEAARIDPDEEREIWRQVQWGMKYDYLPQGVKILLTAEGALPPGHPPEGEHRLNPDVRLLRQDGPWTTSSELVASLKQSMHRAGVEASWASDQVLTEIVGCLTEKRKINAIKVTREVSPLSLKEAKDFVEKIQVFLSELR